MKTSSFFYLIMLFLLLIASMIIFPDEKIHLLFLGIFLVMSFTFAQISPKGTPMRTICITLFYAILIEITSSLFRLSGIYVAIPANFVIFYILTYLWLKRTQPKVDVWKTYSVITMGILVVQLPLRIMSFESTLVSLPDAIMHLLAVLLSTLTFIISGNKRKIALSSISLIFCFLITFWGYGVFLNKIMFGTFTGTTDEEICLEQLSFNNKENVPVNMSDYKEKYLILVFWDSTCKHFKEFPRIQELYDTYKDNEEMYVIPVFCYNEKRNEPYSRGFEIMQKMDYDIPTIITPMGGFTLERLGVKIFPTTIVINNEGRIVYRGKFDEMRKTNLI